MVEPTTYIADRPETAWLEVGARFGQVRAEPDAFRLYRVLLPETRLADLTHSKHRAELLRDPAPPICLEIARSLRRKESGKDSGYDGLIYPSLRNRPQGICAAIFLERVKKIALEPAEAEWSALKERFR